MSNTRTKTLFLAQFALLLAILAIFCFTPLGSIPIGPMVATLAMIPIIITGIVMGAKAGLLMGFFGGLFSFLVWTFMPPSPPVAFVFTPFYSLGDIKGNALSLVICFVPRMLVGLVSALIYKAFKRVKNPTRQTRILQFGLSGLCGSIVNTVLVLGGIWAFFGAPYTAALGLEYAAIFGLIGTTILTNGIPEAIISALAAYFICLPVLKRRTV
jgi:uncharacterized membrane protein